MPQLEKLIASVLAVDEESLKDADGPNTIEAWDSLNHVVLAGAIEDGFSVTFSVDELMSAETVGDFRRLLAAKGSDV